MFARILISLAAYLLLAAGPSVAETITLAGDAWCPYNCQSGLANEGYVVDLAREIFSRSGIRVEYRVVSWERALADVRNGDIDGIIGVEKREAKELVFPQETIGASAFALFVRKDDPWRYKGVSSLEGRRLGLPLSYGLEPDMQEFFKRRWWSVHLQYVGGKFPSMLNVKKLVADRVDVIMDDINVIRHTALILKLQDHVHFAGSDNVYTPIYIGFSPAQAKSGKYADILSLGIRSMRQSGELQPILDRYGLKDWESGAK